nr:unnamed protein product [Callosobruchus analis]
MLEKFRNRQKPRQDRRRDRTSKTPTMPSRGVNVPAASAADAACTTSKQTDKRTASAVPLENNEIIPTAQVAGVSNGSGTNSNAERNVTASAVISAHMGRSSANVILATANVFI